MSTPAEAYLQTMRTAFALHYRDGSDEWSREAEMRQFPEFVCRHFTLPIEGRVLDIGCGRGDDVRYFSERCGEVIGIDLFEHPAWILAETSHHNLSFVCADLQTYQDNYPFDLILDNGSFHHQHESQYTPYLARIRSILKPDGCFAISTFDGNISSVQTDHHGRLHRFFDDDELCRMLSIAGFNPMAIEKVLRSQKNSHYRYVVCR